MTTNNKKNDNHNQSENPHHSIRTKTKKTVNKKELRKDKTPKTLEKMDKATFISRTSKQKGWGLLIHSRAKFCLSVVIFFVTLSTLFSHFLRSSICYTKQDNFSKNKNSSFPDDVGVASASVVERMIY